MPATRSSLLVVSAGLSLALGACGGAGNGSEAKTGSASATAARPEATVAASGPAKAREQAPAISDGKPRPSRPRDTDPAEKAAGSSRRGANPCELVTRAEAQTIVGTPVAAPNLAPQGPTCIYATPKQSVTLALQDAQLTAAVKSSRSTIKLKVAGKPAYCVDDGALRVLVPLESGKTLVVAAACPIAARFANQAIRRLAG